MIESPIDWPDLDSLLKYYPDHVQEIGLITIEITNLEVMLGALLGALLNFQDNISHQIYFTPRAAIARLDVLVNVAQYPRFDEHPELRASVMAVAKKAKAVMGKRHDIIHAHWATSADGTMVGRLRPPFGDDAAEHEIVPLDALKKLVGDIRALVREARYAMDEAYAALQPEAWPQIRAELERTAKELRQGNIHQEGLYQARLRRQ
jgi:hypothetical protein